MKNTQGLPVLSTNDLLDDTTINLRTYRDLINTLITQNREKETQHHELKSEVRKLEQQVTKLTDVISQVIPLLNRFANGTIVPIQASLPIPPPEEEIRRPPVQFSKWYEDTANSNLPDYFYNLFLTWHLDKLYEGFDSKEEERSRAKLFSRYKSVVRNLKLLMTRDGGIEVDGLTFKELRDGANEKERSVWRANTMTILIAAGKKYFPNNEKGMTQNQILHFNAELGFKRK